MTAVEAAPPEAPRSGSSLTWLRALLALAIVVPLALLAAVGWWTYRESLVEAERQITLTADVLREHAVKVFDTAELVAVATERLLDTIPRDEIAANEQALHLQLNRLVRSLPQLSGAGVIDPDGTPLVSARVYPLPETLNLSDRDYFQEIRNNPTRAEYIGRALRSWQDPNLVFFTIARPWLQNEQVSGVLSISVDPAYFREVYARFAGDTGLIAGLVRTDGSILALHPFEEIPLDTIPPVESFAELIRDRPERGVYRTPSGLDGSDWLVAFNRVAAHDAYVAIALPLAGVRTAWLREMGVVLAFAVPFMIALVGISFLALRNSRREGAALAELREETARRELTEAQLRQANKMEAVGQLSGGIAHDFNNLLTAIGGNLELLARRLPEDATQHRLVSSARQAVTKAAQLTQRLLAFSRRQPLNPEAVDVNRLISGMADLLHRTLGETVALETVLAAGLWRTLIDVNQLENALLNLAINARDAMPMGGRLTIETANAFIDESYVAREGLRDVKTGQFVLVAVSDTGTGMSRATLERAFDPFFTTKAPGQGTGLGLSMVYGFVKQSGGHAKIYSEEGHGTTVRLYLPRAFANEAEHAAAATAEIPAPPVGKGESILVVEDDAGVLEFEREALAHGGYRVIEAHDGPEALQQLEANPSIDLLLTDIVLPNGMNGRQVAEAIQERRPSIKVLYATGYTRNAIVHHGRLDPGVVLLSKPFSSDELLRAVRRILDGPA